MKQPTQTQKQPTQKFDQIYEQGDPRIKEMPIYFNGKLLSPSDPQYKELMAGYQNQMKGGKPQVKYDVPPEFKEQFAKMQQQGQFPTTLQTTTQIPKQAQKVQAQIPQAQIPMQGMTSAQYYPQYQAYQPMQVPMQNYPLPMQSPMPTTIPNYGQKPVIRGPTPGLPIMHEGKLYEVNDPMYQQIIKKYEALNQESSKITTTANPHGFDGFMVNGETIKAGDPRYEKLYQDYLKATGKH